MSIKLPHTLFICSLMVSSGENWTPPSDLLELCPYTSFCEYSMSKQFSFDYSAEFAPCCRPCSCSKLCGLHGNCCHRDLDNYPETTKVSVTQQLVQTYRLFCHSPTFTTK